MRDYAKREGLEISTEYVEKQSAKVPGRPILNKMLDEVEKLGGNILAWHPDRLARNSVNGGRVIYLLDTGKLAIKFMLNIAFGQSKYYVDSLSENTNEGCARKYGVVNIPHLLR